MCLHAPEEFSHNIKSLRVVLWSVKHPSSRKHESNRFSKLNLTWIWDWQRNNYFDQLESLYFSEILSQRSMYRVKTTVKTKLFYVKLIFWLFLLILLLRIHTGLINYCLFITSREKQIKAAIHHFFSFINLVWNSSKIQQQSVLLSVAVNVIKEKIHFLASLLTLSSQDFRKRRAGLAFVVT